MTTFFIAGTDTDVGKTLVTCALLEKVKQGGGKSLGLKPVAAGCQETELGLRNQDALDIIDAMSVDLPYDQVNPVALLEPMAPHIAAERAGKKPSVARLSGICRGALMQKVDLALVEGAGGWRVPLNNRETLAMLAKELQLPVILVVGMRLGCINHTLLTLEAIQRDGLQLAGWVANQLEPDMLGYDENLATLTRMVPAPMLGHIPRLSEPTPNQAMSYLDLDLLL
jgi:dethiobiotin synthetase